MFWMIAFSVYVLYFFGAIPMKLYHYGSGKETSSLKVKIEELSSNAFYAVGLFAVYAQINQQHFFNRDMWLAWLIIIAAYSFISLFYSPKMKHVANIAGKKALWVGCVVAHIVFIPMYYAVFTQFGAQT